MDIELTREFEIGKPVFNGKGILTFESFRELAKRMSVGAFHGELGLPSPDTFAGDRKAYFSRYISIEQNNVAVIGKSLEVAVRDGATYFRVTMIPFGPLAESVTPDHKIQLRGVIQPDDMLRIITFDAVQELSPRITFGKNTNGPTYQNNGS